MPILFNEQHAMEPGPCSIFPNFVGAGVTAVTSLAVDGGYAQYEVGETVVEAVSIVVDGGSVAFVVNEVVTGDGVGNGSGTILAIVGSSGVWDAGTHTGTATLILGSVTGTWTNNENITGNIAGVAVGDGTGTGTGGGTGVIEQINSISGVWDNTTHSGKATLVLSGVSGTFTNNAYLWSAPTQSVAQNDGTGTTGNLPNDPTSVKGKGVASVVASDTVDQTGRYTITLRDRWAGLLAVKFCYLDTNSTDDWECTVVSEAVATDKTIVIQVFKSGSVSPSATDERVYLELVLATSSMKPVSY